MTVLAATLLVAAVAVQPSVAATPAPAIAWIAPSTGPTTGGTRVTVHGTGFSHVRAVRFGRQQGTALQVISPTKLRATAPAHVAAKVDVRVVTSHGTSPAQSADRFQYRVAQTPGAVTAVHATAAASGVVHLDWINPRTAGFAGVLIRRALGTSAPTGPADGTAVTDVAAPGRLFADAGVKPGSTYSYGLFAHDAFRDYAAAANVTVTVPQPDWTAQALPFDTDGPGDSRLNAIACPDLSTCVAVGSVGPADISTNGVYTGGPMASVYTGGTWQSTTLTTPPGATYGNLSTISCTDAAHCTAAGSYSLGGQYNQYNWLVETYNDGEWTASGIALPQDAQPSGPFALSCPTPVTCVAVGLVELVTGTQVLTATLADGAWTLGTVPAPTGFSDPTQLRLNDVSCVDADHCTAVGLIYVPHSGGPDDFVPLIERLVDGVWQASAPAAPLGAAKAALDEVNCTAANACVAHGIYIDAADHPQVFRETLSLGAWQLTWAPPLNPGSQIDLTTMTCPQAGLCRATGREIGGHQVEFTWTAGAWSTATLPEPPDLSGTPMPVAQACPSAQRCVVVGFLSTGTAGPNTYAAELAGGTWAASIPQTNNPDALLVGVSCPVAGSCVAVGDDTGISGMPEIFGQQLFGGVWTRIALPTIPLSHANQNALQSLAVSCPSVATCTVLATSFYIYVDDSGGPFAITNRSGEWSATQLHGDMLDIACPAAAACVAVGSSGYAGTGRLPAVEIEDASGWHFQTLATPAGGHDGQLTDVACVTGSHCVGVGTYTDVDDNAKLLVETFADGMWTPSTMSLPPAMQASERVSGISCPTITYCVVVGHYTDAQGNLLEFAATFDGANWSTTTLPTFGHGGPTYDNSGEPMFSVSCTSPGVCTAAGSYIYGGYRYPIVDTLHGGVWTLRMLPEPDASVLAAVADLSCPGSGGGCVAVGRTQVGVGQYPLVETGT